MPLEEIIGAVIGFAILFGGGWLFWHDHFRKPKGPPETEPKEIKL